MKIAELHDAFLDAESVSIDTRTLTQGAIFFALSGENFDANQYVHQALDKGALYAVMDNVSLYDAEDKRMILVKDALKALQEVAKYHRSYLGTPIISLTGSNGKTTTKNLMQLVLSQQYNVLATKGNLNNHIGVPLTLLSLTEEHDFGIIEMGANHLGEINQLCHIANPNYGYVTNFGKAHLEGFQSVEGVIRAKSELYRYLESKKGVAFVYKNDAKQMILTDGQERVLFESGTEEISTFQLYTAQPKLQFRYKEEMVHTELVGSYNFVNCIAALAIGEYFGVPIKKSIEAVTSYQPDNNRSQLIKTEKNLLLLDAYNANPTSVLAAIESFVAERKQEKKVLILGDMFELGAYAAKEHQAIVDLLKDYTSIEIYLVGENYYKTTQISKHISLWKTRKDLETELVENKTLKDCYILLKGSRGMELEALVKYL